METIVVPTDFSTAASNAVDYAVELAKFFNAKIILVNAYPIPPLNYEITFSIDAVTLLKEISDEKLLQQKNEVHKKHGWNVTVECISEMGSPFEVIEEISNKVNADLVVLGIVGKAGNVKEYIIGSTAVKVARKLDIPTFIIPETLKYQRIHKISFACDMNKTEQTDLVYVAKFFSKIFDAELEVINVTELEEEITTEKSTTFLFIEDKLKSVNHKTLSIAGDKNVSQELEDYFKDHSTDVIMLSPKKHNLFYHLFNRSVTHNLAFHSGMPILAIH